MTCQRGTRVRNPRVPARVPSRRPTPPSGQEPCRRGGSDPRRRRPEPNVRTPQGAEPRHQGSPRASRTAPGGPGGCRCGPGSPGRSPRRGADERDDRDPPRARRMPEGVGEEERSQRQRDRPDQSTARTASEREKPWRVRPHHEGAAWANDSEARGSAAATPRSPARVAERRDRTERGEYRGMRRRPAAAPRSRTLAPAASRRAPCRPRSRRRTAAGRRRIRVAAPPARG